MSYADASAVGLSGLLWFVNLFASDLIPITAIISGTNVKTEVFQVITQKDVHHGQLRKLIIPMCVGRPREAQKVVSYLKAKNSPINKIVITGEPGIGKTTIAVYALQKIGTPIGSVIDLHCSKIYKHNAYFSIAQYLIKEIQKSEGSLSTKSIVLFLDSLGISKSSYHDALIRLLIKGVSIPEAEARDPFTANKLLNQALLDIFIALISDTMRTIFVDDMQWIDPSSEAILEAILGSDRISDAS